MLNQAFRDEMNEANTPDPSYVEALQVVIAFCDFNVNGPDVNDEYLRGQVELIADCWGKPGVPLDARMNEVRADMTKVQEAGKLAQVPEGCTGYVMEGGGIQHDGDTCPVHEGDTAHDRAVGHIEDHGLRRDLTEPENIVAELLTDVRHYCDAHGLDYGHIDRQAHDTYLNDRREG